jgi:thiosulfate/3-mercaptopyruvate sulfurtransferase
MNMSHLIQIDWLNEHLEDPQVRVVDCRFVLGNPAAGQQAYAAGHLPGAVYFDLEQDLSAPKQAHGGRHPLPDLEALAAKLGRAGIGADTKVVAYDDQGGAMASRLWWLLTYMGHDNAFVLNGTYADWTAQGLATSQEVTEFARDSFPLNVRADLAVSMAEVQQKRTEEGVVLIDSREAMRYRGEQEPIDPVAGHIPGAVNSFWKDSLNEAGRWKSADEQKARFAENDDVAKAKEIIVYCGSGVTACPNVLALREAGYENVKLYLGSWSDWCSYQDNPIAKDER